MKKFTFPTLSLLVILAVGQGSNLQAQALTLTPAETTMQTVASKGKFLFVLFWKADDAATSQVRTALGKGLANYQSRAEWTAVNISTPAEKPLVDRYDLTRAPMPMVMVFAPNRAVTGAFPLKLTEANIQQALVSPATAKLFKALQSKKLALLYFHPGQQVEMPTGIRQFLATKNYRSVTEVIPVSLTAQEEQGLLEQMQINPTTGQPVTVFMAPPGVMLGRFEGQITAAALTNALKTSSAGCCPGGKCGPNGCCPK